MGMEHWMASGSSGVVLEEKRSGALWQLTTPTCILYDELLEVVSNSQLSFQLLASFPSSFEAGNDTFLLDTIVIPEAQRIISTMP
jgi:hypothetical protein